MRLAQYDVNGKPQDVIKIIEPEIKVIEKSEIKKIIQSKNQAVSMDFDLSLLDL